MITVAELWINKRIRNETSVTVYNSTYINRCICRLLYMAADSGLVASQMARSGLRVEFSFDADFYYRGGEFAAAFGK